jgi:glutamyl-tRNA reductase
MITGNLSNLKVVAFTHKHLPFEVVGKFHIDPEKRAKVFADLTEKLNLKEFMYISTCNRVEFIAVETKNGSFTPGAIAEVMVPNMDETFRELSIENAEVFSGEDGVKHLFKVSASLDSMVIGEREIITQVRKSFEECSAMGLTGDTIRLIMKKTIEAAKTIFTETEVFKKPVSVVSLAFHRLRDLNTPLNSRVIMVGAGKTNKAMARFLSKHGFSNILIFNRSLSKAEKLAEEIGAKAAHLSELTSYKGGFDVLISCTSSETPIINKELYQQLEAHEGSRKIIIDLAIPQDIAHDATSEALAPVEYIDIDELKTVADKNLAERSKEIVKCEEIIDHKLLEFHDICKEREIELAMREIPRKVKEIKETALKEVYAREIEGLNPESREVLDKVISYLEKKYITVPMKMAREVMLSKTR